MSYHHKLLMSLLITCSSATLAYEMPTHAFMTKNAFDCYNDEAPLADCPNPPAANQSEDEIRMRGLEAAARSFGVML